VPYPDGSADGNRAGYRYTSVADHEPSQPSAGFVTALHGRPLPAWAAELVRSEPNNPQLPRALEPLADQADQRMFAGELFVGVPTALLSARVLPTAGARPRRNSSVQVL
jgi:hypothetical protein